MPGGTVTILIMRGHGEDFTHMRVMSRRGPSLHCIQRHGSHDRLGRAIETV
jgi:hypothetical protein